jgi:hypothetical protein
MHIRSVTDLQGPPSETEADKSIVALKRQAQDFARQQMTCDHGHGHISYLESADAYKSDTLAIGRMVVQ